MAELFVANEPLALFAFFIVRMITGFYLFLSLLLAYSLGMHLRHFICGGCLQVNMFSFFSVSCSLLMSLFLLTRQLMHMAFYPWLHLFVLNM